jgi:hypothetical protein
VEAEGVAERRSVRCVPQRRLVNDLAEETRQRQVAQRYVHHDVFDARVHDRGQDQIVLVVVVLVAVTTTARWPYLQSGPANTWSSVERSQSSAAAQCVPLPS